MLQCIGNPGTVTPYVSINAAGKRIIEVGIQLHLAELSLSNTKQYLEGLGAGRS